MKYAYEITCRINVKMFGGISKLFHITEKIKHTDEIMCRINVEMFGSISKLFHVTYK